MNFNKKNKIIAFMILLTCLVSISAVSAVDNNSSDNILSTSMDDISVSDVSDSINTNKMSDASKNSTGEDKSVLTVSSSDKTEDSSVNNLKAGTGTFSDIQTLIDTATEDSINLTESYYVGDGTQININRPITINGNGAILDANGLSRIFYVDADYVTLKNIKFINASDENFGAIMWVGTDGNLKDCTFTNCVANGDYGRGGAIGCMCVNFVVSGCNFTNCGANVGAGAILIECDFIPGDNIITVNDCTFTNCVANDSAGAIGGVEVKNFTVSGCNFTNCRAPNAGAAMVMEMCYNCSVSNCSFINCNSRVYGVIAGGEVKNFTVSGCSFTNSSDDSGCVICGVDVENFTVNNCIFYSVNGSFNGQKVIGDLVVNGTLLSDNSTGLDYVKNGIMVNGIIKNVTIDNSTGVISNADFGSLAPGVYEAFLMDDHNNTFVLANNTYIVESLTTDTTITAQKGKVYNGNYYKVTLKDAKGKALANKKVVITILSKKYTATTDKNGIAKVKVSVAKKYLGKSLKVSYKFAGDSKYNNVSGSTKIKVVKMSTKITNVSHKVVKNHKYFYVKLTTKTGKVIKSKIVIMKSGVSGKTYKIKTNSKGIVKTNLWVKYHPVGKYYKYTFKFAGNNYYKACFKTFRIKIIK